MTEVIKYGEQLIGTGYLAKINTIGNENGYGSCGAQCMIEDIKKSKRSEISLVLRSLKRNQRWCGVNEFLPVEYGLETPIDKFFHCFDIIHLKAIVVENFKITSKNFCGLEGRIIAPIFDGRNNKFSLMIEFDCYIPNGGCADGLGKYGQCAAIPAEYVDIFIEDYKIKDLREILSIEQQRTADRVSEDNRTVGGRDAVHRTTNQKRQKPIPHDLPVTNSTIKLPRDLLDNDAIEATPQSISADYTNHVEPEIGQSYPEFPQRVRNIEKSVSLPKKYRMR